MVVVLDETLLDAVDIVEGTDENGIIIVNTPKTPAEIRTKLNMNGRKVFTLNANQLAQEVIGRPIPNTVMLGALIKSTQLMKMDT